MPHIPFQHIQYLQNKPEFELKLLRSEYSFGKQGVAAWPRLRLQWSQEGALHPTCCIDLAYI